MASVNKATLLGNLGKDPEVRYTPAGTAVCNFSVATSRAWKDKAGVKQEEVEWHNIVAFDRLAEVCAEYLKKGSKVYVEGRIKTEKWEKDGVDHRTTKIYAQAVQFLDTKKDGAGKEPGPATTPTDTDDVPF